MKSTLNKITAGLFIILLTITISSWIYINRTKTTTPKTPINPISVNFSLTNQTQNNSNTTALQNSPQPGQTALATTTVKINTTIIAGNHTYPLAVSPSTTVYKAMQLLQIDSRQPFSFSTKEYPGMGYFVDEINNIKNNNQMNEYWIYYINGQSAQMGISNYIIKNNDIITWKYEKAKF